MNNSSFLSNPCILAFVGMPGSGKSEVISYLKTKDFPFIRFGDLTETELKSRNMPVTPENEQKIREQLRKEYGMAVYAERALPVIEEMVRDYGIVMIDGLYSWEEYKILKSKFPTLKVVFVFTEAELRYDRLAKRLVRPLTHEEAEARDIAEIEHIHKSGPIARADYLLDNNKTLPYLYEQIDFLLNRLGVNNDTD